MKKIINFLKKNTFGFIIGTILFGGIAVVYATAIASNTVDYETSANANVATVKDALDDLYSIIMVPPVIECYNGTCGELSYRYWNDGFSNTTYQSNAMPTINYATRALLEQNYGSSNFTSRPFYIRSILIDGVTVGHQVCLWQKSKEYCMGNNYWVGTIGTTDSNAGTQTKIKLQRDMKDALGVPTGNSNCYSGSIYSFCNFGSFVCYAVYDGIVDCESGSAYCFVYGDGSAKCFVQ